MRREELLPSFCVEYGQASQDLPYSLKGETVVRDAI